MTAIGKYLVATSSLLLMCLESIPLLAAEPDVVYSAIRIHTNGGSLSLKTLKEMDASELANAASMTCSAYGVDCSDVFNAIQRSKSSARCDAELLNGKIACNLDHKIVSVGKPDNYDPYNNYTGGIALPGYQLCKALLNDGESSIAGKAAFNATVAAEHRALLFYAKTGLGETDHWIDAVLYFMFVKDAAISRYGCYEAATHPWLCHDGKCTFSPKDAAGGSMSTVAAKSRSNSPPLQKTPVGAGNSSTDIADATDKPTTRFPGHQRVTYEYFNAHAGELTKGNKDLEDAIRTTVDSTVALLEVKDGESVVNGTLEMKRGGGFEIKKTYSGSGLVVHPCYVVADQHEVNKKRALPDGLKGLIPDPPDWKVSPIGYRTTVRRKDAYTGVVEEVAGTVIDALGDPTTIQRDGALIRLDHRLSVRKVPSFGQREPKEIPKGSIFLTGYPGDMQPDLLPEAVVIDLGCSIYPASSIDGKVDIDCVTSPGGSGGPVSALVVNSKRGLGFHVLALATGGNGQNGTTVLNGRAYKIPLGENVGSEVGNWGPIFGPRINKELKSLSEGDLSCPKGPSPQERETARKLFASALALYQQNDFPAAKRDFEACLDVDPANGAAHFYLAEALIRLGDKHAALMHYDRAEALAPTKEERERAEKGRYKVWSTK